ncbi:MAG: ABC transporter permease [Pigmentiphaga sp.]|nr:ABC transporter permease [Pigmentiphaga sp.]
MKKTIDMKSQNPFWSFVYKEIGDQFRSKRMLILFGVMALTCIASLYTALTGIRKLEPGQISDDTLFFLNMFTISDGTLPAYFVFISFLGPLLGLTLGFDTINSEHNRGTLSRLLAQPIPRDYVINAKFTAAFIVLTILFSTLSLLVVGAGLIAIGIPPSPEELIRIISFTLLSIIYVALWLNLSVYFSVKFRQPATSAIAGIAVWLFFTVFAPLIINLILNGLEPSPYAPEQVLFAYEKFKFTLIQFMPNELYSQATSTLLIPTIRNLGPLTMEQIQGAIPGPLPVGQSLLLVWPQLTGIIAITMLFFIFSYLSFMRKEVRS